MAVFALLETITHKHNATKRLKDHFHPGRLIIERITVLGNLSMIYLQFLSTPRGNVQSINFKSRQNA